MEQPIWNLDCPIFQAGRTTHAIVPTDLVHPSMTSGGGEPAFGRGMLCSACSFRYLRNFRKLLLA